MTVNKDVHGTTEKGCSEIVIRTNQLWWQYQGATGWALKNINLEIRRGEIIGLTGPSGAGKSTLSMCLTGLIPQRSVGDFRGEVKIKNLDTQTASVFDMVQTVGLVFQDPETQFVTMSVEDEIAFPMENFGFPREVMAERIEWAIKETRLEGLRERYPFELSGGQKQRVAIASALALRPEVIILDEPTSDLDPVGKREVFQVISRLRKDFDISMVIVEHFTEELVKHVDRLILLYDGRIIRSGPPRDFFSDLNEIQAKGVYPPQVAEWAQQLIDKGLLTWDLPLTIEEAVLKYKQAFDKPKLHKNPEEIELLQYQIGELPQPLTPKAINVGSYRIDENEIRNLDGTALIISNLSFRYPDGTLAIRNIDLRINQGEYVAIIGQNGSGKTTLVKNCVGFLRPTTGNVKLFGVDTAKVNTAQIASVISYVYQNPDYQLFTNSVWAECAFGPRNLGLPEEEINNRVDKALKAVGLHNIQDEHPFFLSKGQRQRLAVASILTMDPEIIIVDEPTTGQDRRQSKAIMNLLDSLHKQGKTVIVITHD
ncbi:MAG: ABC transporter ATP-binding protein, partial [Candidatus Ranarchaeia archaeon]